MRAASLTDAVVAFDAHHECRLEMTADSAGPATWLPLDLDAVVPRRFRVLDRSDVVEAGGRTVALRVEDDLGNRLWLRNAPAVNDGELASRWRCVVDPNVWQQQQPRLRAEHVELRLPSDACPYLAPLLGSAADASRAPYSVVGFGLFAGPTPTGEALIAGETGVVVGVRLASADGERRLTVASTDFDRCFAEASAERASPSAVELTKWSSHERAPLPAARTSAVFAATGVDLAGCVDKAAPSVCAAPVQRYANLPWPSLTGGAVIVPQLERIVEAWFMEGDRLGAAAPPVRITISTPRGTRRDLSSAVARATHAASQARWNALGFAVGSESRGATHRVVVDLRKIVQDPIASEGGPTSPSARTIATRLEAEQAEIDLTAARLEMRYAQAIGAAEERHQRIRESGAAVRKERVAEATRHDDAARIGGSASGTSKTRVHGVVHLHTLAGVGERSVELSIDAIVAAPMPLEHEALAAAIVEAVGRAIALRMTSNRVAAEPSASPVSAAGANVAALRAAGGGSATLIARLPGSGVAPPTENFMPIRLPADSAGRCFAFGADATTGPVTLLELGTLVGSPARFVPIARDARGESEAGFELCALAAGDYVVHSLHDDTASIHVLDTTATSARAVSPTSGSTSIHASTTRSDAARERAAGCGRACAELDDGSNTAYVQLGECRARCEGP